MTSSSNAALQQAFIHWARRFHVSADENPMVYRWCQAAFFGGCDAVDHASVQFPTVTLEINNVKYKVEPISVLLHKEGNNHD